MKGKGTAKAIFLLIMLSERAIGMQKDFYPGFIDYEKAFGTVRHQELLRRLARLGVNQEHMRMNRNLYHQQKAGMKVGNELTEFVDIKRSVRQRCGASCPPTYSHCMVI